MPVGTKQVLSPTTMNTRLNAGTSASPSPAPLPAPLPAPMPMSKPPPSSGPPASGNTLKKLASKMSFFNKPVEANPGKKCRESDIRTIVGMGFTRDQAVWALMQSDQNVVMAINALTA